MSGRKSTVEEKLLRQSREKVLKKRISIERRFKALGEEFESLRKACTHPEVKREYRSNTGNYDPSADSYWIDCECYDCGKFWSEKQ